jgi:hypothetical protein
VFPRPKGGRDPEKASRASYRSFGPLACSCSIGPPKTGHGQRLRQHAAGNAFGQFLAGVVVEKLSVQKNGLLLVGLADGFDQLAGLEGGHLLVGAHQIKA